MDRRPLPPVEQAMRRAPLVVPLFSFCQEALREARSRLGGLQQACAGAPEYISSGRTNERAAPALQARLLWPAARQRLKFQPR
ncbi:hypothetical protein BDY21DRAFT_344168 [Lineolata rhizophorae]|uniref:Uncharacterized protein n=1 Tax=Lineolata rhizophorae TaxID=578093 RepID=A0A6A6P0R2_9PEZI|nr:hypothetical protein BDY21DRAFT_344168 [Lineolata rhizophorae]